MQLGSEGSERQSRRAAEIAVGLELFEGGTEVVFGFSPGDAAGCRVGIGLHDGRLRHLTVYDLLPISIMAYNAPHRADGQVVEKVRDERDVEVFVYPAGETDEHDGDSVPQPVEIYVVDVGIVVVYHAVVARRLPEKVYEDNGAVEYGESHVGQIDIFVARDGIRDTYQRKYGEMSRHARSALPAGAEQLNGEYAARRHGQHVDCEQQSVYVAGVSHAVEHTEYVLGQQCEPESHHPTEYALEPVLPPLPQEMNGEEEEEHGRCPVHEICQMFEYVLHGGIVMLQRYNFF